MGLLDSVFGKKKLKAANRERLFALTTAGVTLELEGLKPGGAAAVTFKPLSAGEFASAENEIQQLLEAVAESSGSKLERREDAYGYQWIVIRDEDLEDLVTAVHLVSQELDARGFGDRLLAAVFRFDAGERPAYWIYGFKQGTYWPFVPTGDGKERDNARELELKAKLENELPVEPDLTKWLGLFGAPL